MDIELDAATALSTLLEPNRLAVAGALVARVRTADELVAHTGLDQRCVLAALGALRQAGLVGAVDDGYVFPAAHLRQLAQLVSEADLPMDPYIGYAMTDEERLVLTRYFRGRTLTQIPVDRSKRLVVLERLALEFDVGRRYDEPEVNAILRPFHLDVAALRRYLVDEDLLDRAHTGRGTRYWRSGGRVPPVPSMG